MWLTRRRRRCYDCWWEAKRPRKWCCKGERTGRRLGPTWLNRMLPTCDSNSYSRSPSVCMSQFIPVQEQFQHRMLSNGTNWHHVSPDVIQEDTPSLPWYSCQKHYNLNLMRKHKTNPGWQSTKQLARILQKHQGCERQWKAKEPFQIKVA